MRTDFGPAPFDGYEREINKGKRMHGDWIQTYTGKQFWPLDPRPEHICIEDIAHALSNLCRYTGHTNKFYCVAQHSCFASHLVPSKFALWGLLHDAAEAYIGDMSRPLKGMLPEFKQIENKIMIAVCGKFGLFFPEPPAVKQIDDALLATEMQTFMEKPPKPWTLPEPPIPQFDIYPMTSKQCEDWFLVRFKTLSKEVKHI